MWWESKNHLYYGWIENGTLTVSSISRKLLARENLKRIKK